MAIRVMVEKDAGTEIGLLDVHYERAGAQIVDDVAEIFGTAEMIVKVKEPSPDECTMLRTDQVLFTYLHLAADARSDRCSDRFRLHRHRL